LSLLLENDALFVSLVIPAYNNADYLADAVRSALAQDYSKLEIIVINDGSTDHTEEVLAQLGSGFYWVSQANMGQSRALTHGWSLAKGDILGYLSADDLLEPDAVSTSVAALKSKPHIIATYGDFKLIDPHSRLIRKLELNEFSYEKMLTQVSCPIGPGAFFRRSAFMKSGPWNPDYRQMPDYDFWLRLGLHGDILHLPQVLASFRIHQGSQTYSITTEDRAAEPVMIVSAVLNDSASSKLDLGIKERALASAFLVSTQLHLRAGRLTNAFRCLRQALQHSTKTVMLPRSFRLLFNAIINRTYHRILWKVRGILGGNSK
jgi:glycosyltransferase involved in cell wall biosynthesis